MLKNAADVGISKTQSLQNACLQAHNVVIINACNKNPSVEVRINFMAQFCKKWIVLMCLTMQEEILVFDFYLDLWEEAIVKLSKNLINIMKYFLLKEIFVFQKSKHSQRFNSNHEQSCEPAHETEMNSSLVLRDDPKKPVPSHMLADYFLNLWDYLKSMSFLLKCCVTWSWSIININRNIRSSISNSRISSSSSSTFPRARISQSFLVPLRRLNIHPNTSLTSECNAPLNNVNMVKFSLY